MVDPKLIPMQMVIYAIFLIIRRPYSAPVVMMALVSVSNNLLILWWLRLDSN